jgi:4a-hydroxytetrahydrobiopterin dehydratase
MTLDPSDIDTALAGLEGWERQGDAIEKTYEFADFDAAIRFMTDAVAPINEMNHHPTWTNTYNTVHVELSSHDAGGVTDRDVKLAGILDQLAGS